MRVCGPSRLPPTRALYHLVVVFSFLKDTQLIVYIAYKYYKHLYVLCVNFCYTPVFLKSIYQPPHRLQAHLFLG